MPAFFEDDTAQVSLDWVALAAGLLMIGTGLISLLGNETSAVVATVERSIGASHDGSFHEGAGGRDGGSLDDDPVSTSRTSAGGSEAR